MEKRKNSTGRTIGNAIRTLTSPGAWTALAIALVIAIASLLIYYNKDNSMEVARDDKIDITPTLVQSIENIGEWEFLSISDEELIDTVRYGFFGDDELARIYYGTLRLGINMREAKPGWIKPAGDSIIVTLPPIKLLDHDFIDEARTRSFFESGKWSHKDKADMYARAYHAMKRRCLNEKNMNSARQNATTQFRNLMRSMGFHNVKITIAEQTER